MRREFFIAILLTLASIPASAAVNAAADYFPVFHGHSGIALSVSIALTLIFLLGAIVVAVGGEQKAEQEARREGQPTQRLRFVIILALGVSAVTPAIWYFWPHPVPIYAPFDGPYREYSDRLGQPLAVAENSAGSPDSKDRGAEQAWLSNAFVIWMRHPGIMCAFDRKSGGQSACTSDYAHSEEYLFENKNGRDYIGEMRKALGRGPKEKVPQGSLAYAMLHDARWKWLATLDAECVVDGARVFYQQFAHGRIYGLFRINPATDETETSDAIVFMTFDDGNTPTWAWSEVQERAAPDITACRIHH